MGKETLFESILMGMEVVGAGKTWVDIAIIQRVLGSDKECPCCWANLARHKTVL